VPEPVVSEVPLLPHCADPRTDHAMRRLAELKPKTLAVMHGSSFVRDGERALLDLNDVLKEIFGDS
jgi:hypothetical protein